MMLENNLGSPFHIGEHQVQKQLGVREKMENFGKRVIRDHMPKQHRDFYQQLPFLIAGTIDDNGTPWVSFIYGQSGFTQSPNEKTLSIKPNFANGDPVEKLLRINKHVALLGIELPTRRRNRLSTFVKSRHENQLELEVIQSFGNCPQYIQSREIVPLENTQPAEKIASNHLTPEMNKLIRASDTFFVASHYDDKTQERSNGADVSHRGGKPGFVRVEDNTLTIPDYLGNFHFNTLGNFVLNPKAGLLFVDFENGHILTLTGHVEILWESEDTQYFEGAERLWKFHVEKAVYLKHSLPFKWSFDSYSPTTQVTGSWPDSEQLKQNALQKNQWKTGEITKIVNESAAVKSFYIKPQNGTIDHFKAGQFLTIKADIDNKQQIRTYTLSNSPHDKVYRISVKQEPQGLFSQFLHHNVNVGSTINFKSASGNFHIEPESELPAVLLAAGIGITPILSMAQHVLKDATRTRHMRPITIICSNRNLAEQPFVSELNQVAANSGGLIRVIWTLTQPEQNAVLGEDYHYKGRISQELLQAILPIDNYEFFLCGPTSFMQNMYDLLSELGITDNKINAEAFGPASIKRVVTNAIETTTKAVADNAIVEFSESKFEQAWSKEGEEQGGTLLEFAESHGLAPSFGCRTGQCGSCKVILKQGEVTYATKPNCDIDKDEVVLCCAKPAKSDKGDMVKLVIEL